MTILTLASLFLVGVFCSLLGGLFGIGGGLVAIPLLAIGLGFDQQTAQGTALLMVVPNVILSIWRYNQHNRIDWRCALQLAIPSLLLAWLGSLLAVGLDAERMRHAFALFLLFLAGWNLFKLYGRPSVRPPVSGWPAFVTLGGISGGLGGLFGVGGAVVATPALTLLFGMPQVVAQGMALALALPSTGVTLITYGLHDQVQWQTGLPMALGGLLAIPHGIRLAHQLPPRRLGSAFSVFMVGCAGMLGW